MIDLTMVAGVASLILGLLGGYQYLAKPAMRFHAVRKLVDDLDDDWHKGSVSPADLAKLATDIHDVIHPDAPVPAPSPTVATGSTS
jgi:hypothetical protein